MFKPGQSGNPNGRPRGARGGRYLALLSLDRMLATHGNQKLLRDALDAQFKKDPVVFFRQLVMPLMPREATLSLLGGGVIKWQSLVGPTDEAAEVDRRPAVTDAEVVTDAERRPSGTGFQLPAA